MRFDAHSNRFISLRDTPDSLVMRFESLPTQTSSICGFSEAVSIHFGFILQCVNGIVLNALSIALSPNNNTCLFGYSKVVETRDLIIMYDVTTRMRMKSNSVYVVPKANESAFEGGVSTSQRCGYISLQCELKH